MPVKPETVTFKDCYDSYWEKLGGEPCHLVVENDVHICVQEDIVFYKRVIDEHLFNLKKDLLVMDASMREERTEIVMSRVSHCLSIIYLRSDEIHQRIKYQ